MRWAITAVLFWNPSLDAARSYCMLAGNDVELQTARGEVMGDLLTRAECAAVRKAAGPRLVCAKYSGEWFLTDSDALKKIGRALALSDCTALSEGSGVELYCTQASGMGTRSWYPTHLTTGERFGRFGTELADCLVLTKNSSPGVVASRHVGLLAPYAKRPSGDRQGRPSVLGLGARIGARHSSGALQ